MYKCTSESKYAYVLYATYRCGVLVREETDQLFNHLKFLPLDAGAVGMNTTECKARDPPQRLTHLELVRMLSPEFLRVQWAGLQSKSWRDDTTIY